MNLIPHPYYSNVICSYLEEVADKTKSNYIAGGIFIIHRVPYNDTACWSICFSDRTKFNGDIVMCYLNKEYYPCLWKPIDKKTLYHDVLIPQLKETIWEGIDKHPFHYKDNNVWLPKPNEELKEQLMIAFEHLFDEPGSMTKKAI
tara:strand:+ start:3213 stop:3647 length:435 start_codon:yes stop_codon:yes gene_type:complete